MSPAGLADGGWLARVHRGVYVAVPLSASAPEEWRADLWRAAAQAYSPCYIAGWSACEHWGLTEQIFRDLMVVNGWRTLRVYTHIMRRGVAERDGLKALVNGESFEERGLDLSDKKEARQ